MLPAPAWKWLALAALGYILLTPWPFRRKTKPKKLVSGSQEHRGIACDRCEIEPIRGDRWMCINCRDYDLCTKCLDRVDDHHNPKHIFARIRIPVPRFASVLNSRELTPSYYPGGEVPLAELGGPTEAELLLLSETTRYSVPELAALAEQFWSLAEPFGIGKPTFLSCLGPLAGENVLLVERIFSLFDVDATGFITFPNFAIALSALQRGSMEEHVQWLVRSFDLNGNQLLTRGDLRRIFRAYYDVSQKAIELSLMRAEDPVVEKFDDHSANPVSAAFASMERPQFNITDHIHTERALAESMSGPLEGLVQSVYRLASETLADELFEICEPRDGHITLSALLLQPHLLPDWLQSAGTIF